MRSAKEQEYFPYTSKTTCYILVLNDGSVRQVQHNQSEMTEAYQLVTNNSAKLYAVWPGQWRSDLFIIDDLKQFAKSFDIETGDDDNHIHDITWRISPIDDVNSRYAYVDVVFNCGCSIWDMGIRKFSRDMRIQKGWDVAVSKGYGSHGGLNGEKEEFTVSVRRNSL